MRRVLTALLAAAVLLTPGGPRVAWADPGTQSGSASDSAPARAIRLEPRAARDVAAALLSEGSFEAAQKLAQTLVRRDPGDVVAQLVLAQSSLQLGQIDRAREAGQNAWRAASTDEERYLAANATAAALALGGQRWRSQFWLRRAAQTAPDEAARGRAIRQFRAVRERTPVSVRLRFGVQPSSNINNGATSDRLIIGGLPFELSGDAQALSGVETRAGADIDWRIARSARADLTLSLDIDTRSYTLSEEAKDQAPDASGADYAYRSVRLGFGRLARDADGRGLTEAKVTLGADWYGGDPLAHSAGVQLVRLTALGERDRLRLELAGERRWRQDNDLRSASTFSAGLSWTRRLAPGQLRFELGVADTASASSAVAHESLTLGVGFSPSEPIFGAEVDLWARAQQRWYDAPFLTPDPRHDDRISLGTTMLLAGVDYYGFAPAIDITYDRTWSSLALYDTESLAVSLGIRSSF
ncbi:tetratricopeptide repeat protein [Mesobaculum littorinae]|nr:tetratricopeptide repeat protein [Mesobaculum littorinae]